jgi:hypothetical protein
MNQQDLSRYQTAVSHNATFANSSSHHACPWLIGSTRSTHWLKRTYASTATRPSGEMPPATSRGVALP